MTELELELIKFDKIINPFHKSIYWFKGKNYKKIPDENIFPNFYPVEEIIILSNLEPDRNIGIDLSETEYIFIDCDHERDYNYLIDYFSKNSIKYILTESRKGHGHFYFKTIPEVKEIFFTNFINTGIHDYYGLARLHPYSPVLPTNTNGRKFIRIEEPDFLPEIFLQEVKINVNN